MIKQPWSAEELAILRKDYADTPTQELADRLGRSLRKVYQAAARHSLVKSAKYLASPHACRLRRGDKVGWAHRFSKGHTPFNKGLRRPGWSPGRMRETQFKRGERNGVAATHYCPIGTVKPDREGYLRIKVRDAKRGEHTGFGNTKAWPLLHRHTWEQHHGPIPAGHIVVFRDRNRSNCELSNLELITLQENMARNTLHRFPKELAQVIQLRGALNRQIRNRTREKQDVRPTQPSL